MGINSPCSVRSSKPAAVTSAPYFCALKTSLGTGHCVIKWLELLCLREATVVNAVFRDVVSHLAASIDCYCTYVALAMGAHEFCSPPRECI